MIENLFKKGTDAFEKVGNNLAEMKNKVLDFVPSCDFGYIEDKLVNLGYIVAKIEIKLTIPPAVSMEIDLEQSVIDKLNKEKLMSEINIDKHDETEDNKILYKILQGLDYAAKINDKVKFKNKKLSRVLIEGSLIPTVKLIYLDSEVNSNNYLRDKNINIKDN